MSAYEKELLAVVFTVQKWIWRHYLLRKQFVIKTDHRSLKCILEQRFSTAFQQKWLVKLMEFDFKIEYKQGTKNVDADALSRVQCDALVVHQPALDLLDRIKAAWLVDVDLQKIISELLQDPLSHRHYSWVRRELRRKGRLVIGKDQELRKLILTWLHSTACGGHSGRDATLQ